jgi:hypothetical protein
MKPTSSPQDSRWEEDEVIKILRKVGSLRIEYPSELFAVRRAAFVLQMQKQEKDRVADELSSIERFVQHFESLKFARVNYPPELLAARRAAFVELIQQRSQEDVAEELHPDQEMIRLVRRLKSVETEYPSSLMTARRTDFKRQIAQGSGRVSILEILHTSLRNLFLYKIKALPLPTMNMMRTSLVIVIMLLAVFVRFWMGNREQLVQAPGSQNEVAQPGTILTTTGTNDIQVLCKPGYLPPLCLVKEFDKSQDLTFLGNGTARPAVAKDTLPGYSGVHKPAYVNDGLYGPGASWISNSPYSWIKIDLGKATTINMVAFGRDRLGNFNDRDPGQFVIAVALSDDVYADGNSSNDYTEYTQVFDSERVGFDGTVSGPETIQAQFGPVMARFVKIIFTNAGAAVDEVEVFMVQPFRLTSYPTRQPKEDLPGTVLTAVPTTTPLPTKTATPLPTSTPLPTHTPLPTDTATPLPTNTPLPTDTAIPEPTETPIPPPEPTDTSIPPTEAWQPLMAPTETQTSMDGF